MDSWSALKRIQEGFFGNPKPLNPNWVIEKSKKNFKKGYFLGLFEDWLPEANTPTLLFLRI